MNYFVLPGKEKIFEDACANVLGALREASGHDESKIFRNVEAGDPEYLIVSTPPTATAERRTKPRASIPPLAGLSLPSRSWRLRRW